MQAVALRTPGFYSCILWYSGVNSGVARNIDDQQSIVYSGMSTLRMLNFSVGFLIAFYFYNYFYFSFLLPGVVSSVLRKTNCNVPHGCAEEVSAYACVVKYPILNPPEMPAYSAGVRPSSSGINPESIGLQGSISSLAASDDFPTPMGL